MDANLTIILMAAIVTPILAGAISYLLVLSVQRLIFSKDEPDKSGKSMNLMDSIPASPSSQRVESSIRGREIRTPSASVTAIRRCVPG